MKPVDRNTRRSRTGARISVAATCIQCSALWILTLVGSAFLARDALSAQDGISAQESPTLDAARETHWAYIAPKRSELPAVRDSNWPINAIDRFVLARLEKEGLSPSAKGSRRTLHRRLSFDLLGLGPQPSAVESFVRDTRPDAHEQLVDRMLASPLFGERLAVHWLDLVRYADTTGIHADNTWDIYPFRDYVIDAFNSNMRFDRFTREQVAGDLIPGATVSQRIASSYNRLNMISREGGSQEKEFLVKYMADRVRNASTVWLGATLGCAQCHDHKFDPLSMKDFYQFGAFFSDIEERGVYLQGAEKSRFFPPYMSLPSEKQTDALRHIDESIAALAKVADTPPDRIEGLRKRRAALQGEVPVIMTTISVKPRTIRILPRGDWMDESGEIVQPNVPAVFGKLNISKTVDHRRATRLDLASWLMSEDNPVVARVFVNRIWKLFFGRGLVSSLDDFGLQGAAPTHPLLLDFLASEFSGSGWDVKHLIRLIVTSATYRQSSFASDAMLSRDPYNDLLGRQARFRLEAESIRDNALHVSGLLMHRLGGRSVRPYQPSGYYSHLNFPRRQYKHDEGESLYRRSLYTHWQRQFVHPSMLAFDAPSRERCTVERMRSNSPLAALVLLNDPIFVEAARAFGVLILKYGGDTIPTRVNFAYSRALSRQPRPRELRIIVKLFQDHLDYFQADTKAARSLLSVGDRPPPAGEQVAEYAAWTSVARVLLNLHEMITRD